MIARALRYLERILGSSRSKPSDWNREYESGRWSFLGSLEEAGRYWIAAGYCAEGAANPSVLDVGCGEGFFEENLRRLPYGSYTGIDISTAALNAARTRILPVGRLVCTDYNCPGIRGAFDLIIFMDPFTSDMDVPEIMKKYEGLLRPEGRFVLCMFDGKNPTATRGIWGRVERGFKVLDRMRLIHDRSAKSWTIALLARHFDPANP